MSPSVSTSALQKTIRPGRVPGRYMNGKSLPNGMDVFCKIEYDGKRLSITGVEGPLRSGNAYGSCGQIDMHYQHADPADDDARSRELTSADDFTFAEGWDTDMWHRFLAIWKRWHMNDMRAECEHQRAMGWTYDTHAGQDCPECGYRIGSEWRREDIPAEVIAFLADLPDADRVPAWV